MQKLVAAAAVAVLLLLAVSVAPTISPNQDAPIYLAAAHGYAVSGLAHQYPREPFYPLFLATVERLGLPLESALAVVQNALFLAGLHFFLRSMTGQRRRSAEVWAAAALVTLIPTFLVTVNGAMYTESLSCTLIFLLLGSLIRIFSTLPDDRSMGGSAVVRCTAWAIVAMAASASLALTKGSFLYVNVAFGIVGAIAAASIRMRSARRLVLVAAFLGVAIGAWGVTTMWLASRNPRSAGFERGGAIFFGRTEFAARFDFRTQAIPYLVNALSESACRRIYDGECESYTFGAENGLGFRERDRTNGNERTLFAKGIDKLLHQPLRQLAFAVFELTRFVFHHGTTGFAELHAPVLGPLLSSLGMKALLKLFNVLLYLVLPAAVIVLRRRGCRCRDAWRAWPEVVRLGTGLYVAYACLYLTVYGFATTLLRMVYPVAPFLVLFDIQVISAARCLLRSEAPSR
ncbi:MAG: hypothetical protein LAO05_12220 [Acidobacteriia bacterium]|nr:hypothetical protein [Terriglobia bacterium]